MPIPVPSSCQNYIFILMIQALIAFMFFSYNKFHNESAMLPACTNSPPSAKPKSDLVILLWTWPFGNQFPLNQCPKPFDTPQCFFTADHNFYNTANAVVFHHRDVCWSKNHLPQTPRPNGQYWVWFNLESPSHSPNLNIMDKLINLTMSYRSDSDIFTSYGWLEPNEDENFTIPNKSQLVAWVVSNWNPSSKRVQFYDQLKKHIQIDVYGNQRLPLARDETVTVLSRYKFYLAFENSIHKDYITEKLWQNALTSGCVPVVLGPSRENYERFIPSDSFIHVDDFPSAKELASYLSELDKDNLRYEQYFSWRSKLRPVGATNWSTQYCKACVALHKAPTYRTRASLVNWYT